ncbi:MAG: cupin domain-containing protein [Clostridium sp.]|nr:cupin domain-containing protein [Clostridium sp.]
MLQTDYKFGEVYSLAKQITPTDDKVGFQNIFGSENGGVVLLGFKAGQQLTTHTAPAEVMVCVVEGQIEFTMLDMTHTVGAGEFLLMGANVPHSVRAKSDAKVMLVKIK